MSSGVISAIGRPSPRTLLEQLIQQRDATYEEQCMQYDKVARQMGEKATMSVRHLQRLAYGERTGQRSTPTTRRVMRQLFGYPMEDLLGPPHGSASAEPGPNVDLISRPHASAHSGVELAERIRSATRVDAALVRALADQTNYLRVMDRQLAGEALSHQLSGHVRSIRFLVKHAVLVKHRIPLAAVLADVEALAAWVALDLGDVDGAWSHHEAARTAAREADSPALLAHAMVQQAFVLTEVGEKISAVELAREARTIAGSAVPSLLVSWLCAGEGEVLAALGDDRASRAAFDAAARALPDDSAAHPELPYIQLDQMHLARWHGNALARLGDTAAVERLQQALDAPDQSLRARAGLHTDLAYALTATGDRGDAHVQLKLAEEFADRAGSRRQRRRIRQLAAEGQDVQ